MDARFPLTPLMKANWNSRPCAMASTWEMSDPTTHTPMMFCGKEEHACAASTVGQEPFLDLVQHRTLWSASTEILRAPKKCSNRCDDPVIPDLQADLLSPLYTYSTPTQPVCFWTCFSVHHHWKSSTGRTPHSTHKYGNVTIQHSGPADPPSMYYVLVWRTRVNKD